MYYLICFLDGLIMNLTMLRTLLSNHRWLTVDDKCFHLDKHIQVISYLLICISGLVQSLSIAAQLRLSDALEDSTNRSYIAMFRLYLAFLAFTGLAPSQVMVDVV